MAAGWPAVTTDDPGGGIMTSSDLDQITTPPAENELEPAAYHAPAPLARPTRLRADWIAAFRANQRRWWTIALAATLLISGAGVGLLYLDDTNNQNEIHALNTQNSSLTGRNQILNDQLKTTQTNLTATLGELAQTKAQLEHPQVTLWNYPQTIKGADWYLAGGIPDTFTYHLQATSTGPMSVSILTLEQWVKANECVDNGFGHSDYCMHHSGTVVSWLGVTSVNYDFHLAEGCADYLAVFTSATTVTVKPNVSVTYNPASSVTGACA